MSCVARKMINSKEALLHKTHCHDNVYFIIDTQYNESWANDKHDEIDSLMVKW